MGKRKWIYCAGVLGVAAIITTGLLIKCQYNNFSTAGKNALAKEIISTIYPMVETRWLYLMKRLEKSFSIMVKELRDNIEKAKEKLKKDESDMKIAEGISTNLGESTNVAAVQYAMKRVLEAVTKLNQSATAFNIINTKNSAELASMGVS